MVSDLLLVGLILLAWRIWHRVNAWTLNDLLSPFNLLFYFWVLPFLLSLLELSRLQTGLSFEAVLVIVACTLILTAISSVPMFLVQRQRLEHCLPRVANLTSGSPVIALALILYAVSAVAMYFAEFRDGLPVFQYLFEEATDSTLHLAGKDSRLQVVAQALNVAGALCFHASMTSSSRLRCVFLLALALAVPALGLLKASKSGVFMPVLYYTAVYYYVRMSQRENPISTRAIFVLLFAFVAMTFLTTIRVIGVGDTEGFSGQIAFRYAQDIPFPLAELVATIYGYTALGFQNFSNYVDRADSAWRLGTSFFHPLFTLLLQGDWVQEMSVPREEWHVVSRGATIGTYLRDLYMEGGALLCVLGSVVYAALMNWLYLKFRKAGGGIWFFPYVVMLFPWVWIFFQNAFSILVFYTNTFYALATFWVAGILRVASARPSPTRAAIPKP